MNCAIAASPAPPSTSDGFTESIATRSRSRSTTESMAGRFYGRQSAMKTFVSPGFASLRLDAKTRCLPSGENIGKPSKVGLYVTRSRPVPSTLTR